MIHGLISWQQFWIFSGIVLLAIAAVVLIATPSEQPSVAAIDPHARTIDNSAYVNLISSQDDRDGNDWIFDWDHGTIGHHKIVAQIPLRRLGTTDEVAKIIYVLCTEMSSYVNGAEIHINGGQYV